MQEQDTLASIRFFGSIVSTNGISEKAKAKSNEYIEKLVDSLSREVDKLILESAGIVSIK